MDIYAKLFSSFNENSIRYMVAGGVAVNLYGIERATADIDVVIRMGEENLSKFIGAAKKLGLRPKAPVRLEDFADKKKRNDWRIKKGMKVFSLYDAKNPFLLLDIFMEEPFDFDEVYKRRKKVKYGSLTIPVVPMDALIEMKEKSGRPQDRADVYHLKRIAEGWKD